MFSRRALLGFWLLLCLVPGALLATPDTGGLLIRPIEPCVLLDSSKAGRLAVGERQPLWLDEDGAAAGCAPLLAPTAEGKSSARALVLRAEITNVQGKGRLLAGAPGRELLPILSFGEGAEGALLPFALVELCQETAKQACEEGQLVVALEGATADLKLEAIGVLEMPSPGGLAGTEQADQEEDSPSTRSTTAPYWDLGLTNSLSYTDGFVGVGTATPEAEFHVDANELGMIVSQPAYFGTETVSNYFEPRYPALFLRRNSGTRGSTLALGNNSGKMYLYASPGGFKIYDTNAVQRLFLDAEGHLGIGALTDEPAYTLHVVGDMLVRDPTDNGNVVEILPRSTSVNGYAGGNVFTDTRMLRLLSPYQNTAGARIRGYLVFGSPEVFGAESAYIYGFANKNIRLGTANDGYRRSEIELYNNNTSEGKILFRTGLWQDPTNLPASSLGVRMLIDNAGNVGIGNTSPTHLLDILGHSPARVQQSHSLGMETESPYFAPENPTLTVMRGSTTKGATLAIGNQTRKFFFYGNHEVLRLFAPDTTTPIQTMTTDGKVGIGDLIPTEKLEIQGNLKLSGNILSDGDICIGSCQ